MASALLELIGQGVLAYLTGGAVALERLAREVWSGWGRQRDAAGRAEDLAALSALDGPAAVQAAGEAVRRVLPGKGAADAEARAALGRYLAALPAMARHGLSAGIDHADDLLRWLPPRVPAFGPGDHPAGVGDRVVEELLRITPACEVWRASNPRLPGRAPVWLAFFPSPDHPPAPVLDWHEKAGESPAVLAVQHTFLDAPVPCLQLAGGPERSLTALARHPGLEHAAVFRALVERVSALHAREAPLAVAAPQAADVRVGPDGQPVLLVLPAGPGSAREDVLALGRIGQALLGTEQEAIASLFAECQADDPLLRPASAAALLTRLRPLLPAEGTVPTVVKERPVPTPVPVPALAGAAPARGARPRRGARLDQVLDWLQQAPVELPKLVTNSLGMACILIPEGDFLMGSPPGEVGRRDNEGPVHEVHLPAYYLARHLVTQAQYEKVMGVNPARFQGAAGGGPEHPVECVSWDDAVLFCRRLSDLAVEKEAGRSYRLPTEAEWERACRAGTGTPFHFGPALSAREAAIDGNHPYGGAARVASPPRTARVGSFPPNTFGFHDMHGNVWEWCQDWYAPDYYAQSPRQAPAGPESGEYRVLRGGSWRNQAATCRAAYRNALAPNQRQAFLGFRVVLQVSPVAE